MVIDIALYVNIVIDITSYVGIEVDYSAEVAGIQPGLAVTCCLILCWIGDHPAQCKVGKFLGSGGIHACRCDKVKGIFNYI